MTLNLTIFLLNFAETEKKDGRIRKANDTKSRSSTKKREASKQVSKPEDHKTTTRRIVRR